MFSERTDLHRSSRIPHVPGTPFAPAHTVLRGNCPSIEGHAFSLRSVNGAWESIEQKYLENVRRASRP
jgi:hypothetical protein